MKERARRFWIWTAWLGLAVSLTTLVGLRLGRPLFYTDGLREWFAGGLRDASMLAWSTPEPVLELPGPVLGRVARLPDGRLLYGQVQADGTSDLVVFDPERPGLPPEPALGINSRGHDLAPAVGPDGVVYFASDRRGGLGGFDLWMSLWVDGVFSRPTLLVNGVNSELDETDPAPDPAGDRLVFVRRDPGESEGRNGSLWLLDAGAEEPHELFPFEGQKTRERQPLDRDPAFSADGVGLWFVRKVPGNPPRVYRTWRQGGAFADPTAQPMADAVGELRSPMPLADGYRVRLLRPGAGSGPGSGALVYESHAVELYPWWAGQRALELILLGILLLCALLLLLLYMGRRWHQLDVITQCLLLSLLLHLLLLLWLAQMEIVRRFLPDDPQLGGIEVELVSGQSAQSEGGGPVSQRVVDVSLSARFSGHERELAVQAPGVEVAEREDRTGAAPSSPGPSAPAARSVAAETEVRDASAAFARRAGRDTPAAVDAAAMRQVAAAEPRVASQRAAGEQQAFRVEVPAAELSTSGRSASAVSRGATASATAVPSPQLRDLQAPAAAPRDAAEPVAHRQGRDEEPSVALDAVAAEPAAPRVSNASAEVEPRPLTGNATPAPSVPGADLAAAPEAPRAPAPVRAELPRARQHDAAAELADPLPTDLVAAAARDAGREREPALAAVANGSTDPASPPAVRPGSGPEATTQRGAAGPVAAPETTVTRAAARAREATPASAVRPRDLLVAAALRDAPAPDGNGPRDQAEDPASRGEFDLAAAPTAPGRAAPAVDPDRPAAAPRASLGSRQPVTDAGLESLPAARRSAPERRIARSPRPAERRRSPLPDLRDAPASRSASDAVARSADEAALRESPAASLSAPSLSRAERPDRGPRDAEGDALVSLGIRPPDSLLEAAPRRRSAPATEPRHVAARSPYSNRFGPAKAAALERFGGTAATERAVALGLRYLARIQNRDGSWGDDDHWDRKYGQVHVGKTALCLLAFLGAGHTPDSKTEHSEVARKAVDFLVSIQDEDTGAFGRTSSYGHGISTYALAECYGLTRDRDLLRPVEEGLSWILRNQSPRGDRANLGGWGYFSADLRPEDSYSRVSVTAWMVMALESARLSGIEIPEDVLPAARRYLQRSFDSRNGWFRYNHNPSRLRSGWPTLPASTPAAAFCLILMGESPDHEAVRTALDFTVERRPRRYRRYSDDDFVLEGQGNVYFWYYGSLACFLAGGDVWDRWNERLRTLLPESQSEDGSFRPIDVYSEYANDTDRNRAYTTAMCVLSLEVYYRYFTPLLVGR